MKVSDMDIQTGRVLVYPKQEFIKEIVEKERKTMGYPRAWSVDSDAKNWYMIFSEKTMTKHYAKKTKYQMPKESIIPIKIL